jgi:hypothetical protein
MTNWGMLFDAAAELFVYTYSPLSDQKLRLNLEQALLCNKSIKGFPEADIRLVAALVVFIRRERLDAERADRERPRPDWLR